MPMVYLVLICQSRENINQLLDYDNGYFSYDELDINFDYIQSSITKDDVLKIGEQMIQVFSQIISIMTTISIIIYLVIMHILTRLVLDRNTNGLVVVILVLFMSLPIYKYGLETIMIFALTRFSGYIEVYIPFYIFIVVFGTDIITYLIVNLILTKQIQRIELDSSLKK